MNDVKLFAKNENGFKILMLVMNKGKRETIEGIQLPTQKSIKTF